MSPQPNEPGLTSPPNSQLPKAPSFLSRLLGGSPKSSQSKPSPVLKEATGGPLPKKEEFGPAPKPLHQNWEALDVSSGIYRGKDLRTNKQSFKHHVRDDVKDILRFAKADALAQKFYETRGNKLTKTEVRGAIQKLREEGKISGLQARKLRNRFGASKSSFF